jgi:2-haloacid dehalogenase
MQKGRVYLSFYHCLLFDLDGTLLDFKAAEDAALRETLAHFSLPETEEVVERYHAINDALWAALERGEVRQEKLVVQRFEQLLAALDLQENAVRLNDYYLTQLSRHAEAYPGAQEMLAEVAEVATLAVVTNGVERVQLGRLERSGLAPYFDGVFVSGKAGAAKPARRMFDTALDTLGIENRKKVLMVGDSLKADIAGGAAAGLDTCWCNFADAPVPQGGAVPTYTIHGYEELLRIVMEDEELEHVGSKEKRHSV